MLDVSCGVVVAVGVCVVVVVVVVFFCFFDGVEVNLSHALPVGFDLFVGVATTAAMILCFLVGVSSTEVPAFRDLAGFRGVLAVL
jgi:hypothetical protein